MRVAIVLAHDFTLSAFSLFLDHLRLAADDGDGSRPLRANWTILADGDRPACSSCGVSVVPTGSLADPAEYDYVVVVGGLLRREEPIGEAAANVILRAAASGSTLVGLCTGVFILCRLGLMRNKRCCISWYHVDDFRSEFPEHVAHADRLFVIDGKRISCAGGAGTADLAAELIRRHLGPSAAQKANQLLMFDSTRSGNASQPHPAFWGGPRQGKIGRALLLMEQNMAAPLPIDELASRLSLSTRQLERLFRETLGLQPTEAYRSIRLRYAAWLLSSGDRSITSIAQDAGFADGSHFSRLYRAAYGQPPSAARREAAGPPGAELAGPRVFTPTTAALGGLS
jgi:transcriptional regulator GlxA family with amidase domain